VIDRPGAADVAPRRRPPGCLPHREREDRAAPRAPRARDGGGERGGGDAPGHRRARHEFSLVTPPEPLYVEADAARLAQIFSNLLTNAAKYTDPGGRIGVQVERDGNQAVVRVSDNGVGIPPAMLESIFDMFVQVDRAGDHSQGGLGIGLTLVKRLVEMHGGRVEAKSAGVGTGSEFVVRLPLAASARRRSARRRAVRRDEPHRAAHPRRRRQHGRRRQPRLLLRSNGADVRVAYDGLEAVGSAIAFSPTPSFSTSGYPSSMVTTPRSASAMRAARKSSSSRSPDGDRKKTAGAPSKPVSTTT
jgi:anti-sigma regulatory factor (Ser/Thr protein kinase)